LPERISKQEGIVTVVIPPFEFVQIGIEMLHRQLMIRADNRPLEKAPNAFNGVSVDFAMHPLLDAVIDRLVPGVGILNTLISGPIVGVDGLCIVGDVLMDKPVEGSPVNAMYDFEDYLALSLDSTDHCGLVTFVATAMPSCLAANPRLVDLYDAFEREGVGVSHSGTYAMAEIPRRLVGDAQDSLKLLSAHTLLGFHHEQYSHEPLTEREFGIMENGSSKNGELVAT